MRRYTAVLLTILLAVACSKPEEQKQDVVPYLNVFANKIEFEKEGGSQTITFSTNSSWTATTDATWLTLSKVAGQGSEDVQEITLTTEANEGEYKSTKVVFSVEGRSSFVNVTQKSKSDDGLVFVTIPEFISKKDDTNTWYKITGEIVSIENSYYGDFYIMDDLGYLYVYGLSTERGGDKTEFSKLGLKAGDIVSIAAHKKTYNGKAEADMAYFISKQEGKYPGYVSTETANPWLEMPQVSVSDDEVLVTHMIPGGGRNYTACFNKTKRLSNWICYPLFTKGSTTGRSDAYAYDPLVGEDFQANLSKSYQERTIGGEEYIRGHMLPSNDRSGRANLDAFLSTNIMPQSSAINNGVWGDLENKMRNMVSYCDTLYVVVGTDSRTSTTYVKDNSSPQKDVLVPEGIYRVVLALSKKGEYHALAAYYENKNFETKVFRKEQAISVDALEEKLGIDFFVNLGKAVGNDKAAEIEAVDPATDDFWWN